jgi:cell fate regulator YaaT (PSP1 superfamily)
MNDVLEIEFKGRRKEFAANPQQFPFRSGDPAIVEVERGHDLGKVSYLGWRPGLESEQSPAYSVLRKASAGDLKILDQNRQRESEAKRIAKQKVVDHHLDMKLVDVELQWDGRKMTFYFTSEGRVDFRELVKDLAGTFRTRIDLRQIGARDETKRTGGYGICGQPLCCATFLTEFKPITTQMPRDQFLPLNPSKLSGVCGRLKCCLRYELDVYREFQRSCPKVGHPIKDDAKGDGLVEKLDVVREQIQIRYAGGETEKYSPQEFIQLTTWRPEMPKSECICTCGRKQDVAAPVALPMVDQEPSVVESTSGEKVTLLAGGGIGFKGEGGAGQVQAGTSLDVAPKSESKKRRKRRRRGGKKTGGSTQPGTTPPAARDDDEGEDDS